MTVAIAVKRVSCPAWLLSVAVSFAALAGCGGSDGSTSPSTTATVAPTTVTTIAGPRPVPDVKDKDLVTARDILQAAGFTQLVPRDGNVKGRNPGFDPGWVVAFQAPGAGAVVDPRTSTIYLDAVPRGERYAPPRTKGTSPCPRFVQC